MAVRTTHVGSLPRSQKVTDFLFAKERGEAYEQSAFDAAMTEACSETVRLQVEAGVDIVSDGETSKISYATYVKDRYTGFAGDTPRSPPGDLLQFPEFLRRLAKEGGTAQYSRPKCVGEIRKKPGNELEMDIANLKSGIAAHGAPEGFMNAASPGVISLFLPNDYWPSRDAYLEALAQAMSEEYRAIVDSGLLLQVDCPDLGLSRHVMFSDLSDSEFVAVAESNVEALNFALDGIDPSRVRVHICWGNYEGPHICDIGMDKVLATLMKVRAKFVLFESSNPRHAHEWSVFEDRKSEIPDEKVLIPGVIDTTTNFVEHPELVAQRIRRFSRIVGADRIIAGTDCGFGTFAGFGAVDPSIAYAKLAALAEGARLAS
ncbi:MAG: cobalamin-independent methionine synthase II family protein [Albidovulum sp.]|nr:cobalamin-independent methionine synthase II family protein [Albidovulum sp.]MDE0529877.1 cobalamin-independent methionine synthase II family protein [Albidovulum sp.]